MSKTPSNPSPFSPELQAFIVTKYDPLLGVVKTLNERLHATNRDRFRLERRLENLEKDVRDVKEFVAKGTSIATGTAGQIDNVEDELKRSEVRELLKSDAQLIAPWLFSCHAGTPLSTIQVLLDFMPDQTAELDVKDWNRESDLWIDLLENLPEDIPISRPPTLALGDLRTSSRKALMDLVRSEVLIVVRNVPGKDSETTAAASLVLVAILCAAISEAWKRTEKASPTSLGRIAIVLDGVNIGSKLKAGAQKFTIEPLN